MALDIRGNYDESIADLPLDRVRVSECAALLGGKPLLGISPSEVMRKFRVGAVEAGVVQTEIYSAVNFIATTGGALVTSIGPPAGVTWRIHVVSAVCTAANVPVILGSPITLCMLREGRLSPQSPVVHGSTGGAVAAEAIATGDLTFLAEGLAGSHGAAWTGAPFIMRSPSFVVCYSGEAAGRFIQIGVHYSEWPGEVVPPQ